MGVIAVYLFESLLAYSERKLETLSAFSLYSNGKKLLCCESPKSSDVIRCLDWIRAMTAAWIVFGHVVKVFSRLPIRNKANIDMVRRTIHAVETGDFNNFCHFSSIHAILTWFHYRCRWSWHIFSDKWSFDRNQHAVTSWKNVCL